MGAGGVWQAKFLVATVVQAIQLLDGIPLSQETQKLSSVRMVLNRVALGDEQYLRRFGIGLSVNLRNIQHFPG